MFNSAISWTVGVASSKLKLVSIYWIYKLHRHT